MHGLRLRAIVAGLVLDLIGSVAFGVLYSAGKVAVQAADGRVTDEVALTATDYAVASIFGLLLVMVSGYVAGRMARGRPAAHGLCVGIAILVTSVIIELLAPDPDAPLWFNAVSMLGVIPAATIGGNLSAHVKPARRGGLQ